MNKPLPRRKPQLTAAKLTLSDGYRRGPRDDGSGTYSPGGMGMGGRASPSLKSSSSSVPHMLDKHKTSQSFSSPSVDNIISVGFGVGKTTKPPTPVPAAPVVIKSSSGKSSIFSDESEGSDVEKGETVNTAKSVQLSKVEEKEILPVPLPKGPATPSPAKNEVPESSPSPCSKESSARDSSCGEKSASDDFKFSDRESEEGVPKSKSNSVVETKPSVSMPNLKVEEGKVIPFQPYRRNSPSPPERKCEVVPKWDEVDKGDESKGSNTIVTELVERRREKEMELNREFDRLLFSTKTLTLKQGDQQQRPRTPLGAAEAGKAGDTSPSDTAKPSKVYESPRASKVYPSASPQASSRQSSKACTTGKTEVPASTASQPTQPPPMEVVCEDVKDINTHDKNKTKQEVPSWPDRQKETVRSDDKCKDSLEANCKSEPQKGHANEVSLDRTSNKEVVTEQKFCKDTIFDNLPSREGVSARSASDDYRVGKKGSKDKDPELDKNSPVEKHSNGAQNKDHSEEQSEEKSSRNEISFDSVLAKSVPEKKTKETTFEKRLNEDGNDRKKTSTSVKVESKSAKDPEYDNTVNKEVDVVTRHVSNHSKDHSDKKCKRDSNNTHKSARGEAAEKSKQSRSSSSDRRNNRDTSADRKHIRESPPEKKVKDVSEDAHNRSDTHESTSDDTPKASKHNSSEVPDDKKPYRDMPYISCSPKVKGSERRPVKNTTPEKKAVKSSLPERKPGKETGPERKLDLFPEHHKDAAQAKKPVKEASPEKKPSKNLPPDKKIHEPSNNKKHSKSDAKEKKQKTEENLSRKHNKETHGDRKPVKDSSVERPSNKDVTQKIGSSEGIRESKPERELGSESSRDHHSQKPNKDHSPSKKTSKEQSTERQHRESPPEKSSNRDASAERRIKKDLANAEKHRRDHSSDRNQTKDSSAFKRYNHEAECERMPSLTLSGDKKSPSLKKRHLKDLDFLKKIARDHSLEASYAVNNFLHKMSNSKKQSIRDQNRRKKTKLRDRSGERSHDKGGSTPERFPTSENSLKKESGGDATSPREVLAKNKVSSDRWDEYSDGSKFHKAKKLLTEKNGDAVMGPRPLTKLPVSPSESPKFKLKNKSSHADDSILNSSSSSTSSSLFSSPSPGKSTKEGSLRVDNHSPTSGRDKSEGPEKGDPLKSPGDKNPCIRPTIADTVKGRERRKSTDTDRYSGGEKGKRGDMYRDETSTDSETSEELNEKVDLDTEQTQTFSVSESNFNQVS